jgi:hypothetical protein
MAPYTTLQTNSAGVLQPSTNWLRAREAAAALCRRDSGPVFTVGAGLALAVLCVDLRKFPLELAPAEDPLLRSCAVDDDPFRAGGIGTAPGLCVVCTRMDSPGFRAGLVCACDGMRVLGRPRERRLSVPRRGREGTRMQTGQCVARDRATGRATVISTPAGRHLHQSSGARDDSPERVPPPPPVANELDRCGKKQKKHIFDTANGRAEQLQEKPQHGDTSTPLFLDSKITNISELEIAAKREGYWLEHMRPAMLACMLEPLFQFKSFRVEKDYWNP